MKPILMVIDLHGHFVMGMACLTNACIQVNRDTDEKVVGNRVVAEEVSTEQVNQYTLIVFNTTPANYIQGNPAIAWTYDSFYHRFVQ
jgi:hypothetical protein